jgi:hypothetical protein
MSRHIYHVHPAQFVVGEGWRTDPPLTASSHIEALSVQRNLEATGRSVEIERDDGLWLASDGGWERP